MLDATTGWALARGGSALLRTTSGPLHWQEVTPPYDTTTLPISASAFFDSQHAWVTVAPNPGSGAPVRPFAIWRTTDGGQHWQQSLVRSPGYEIADLFFLSPRLGWVAVQRIMGGDTTNAITGLALFRTQDGGATWTLVSTTSASPHAGPGVQTVELEGTGLVFTSPTQGWLVGLAGILRRDGGTNPLRIYRTQDGGQHWTAFPLPQEARSQGLLDLDFVSQTLGWAISIVSQTKQVLLLQTTDGGQTWRVVTPTVAAL